eukprot:6194460-Pleurochrysis_carterae.AAC.1
MAANDSDVLPPPKNSSDVLPPPKNYKAIHGRPDKEELRSACIEEFKVKAANNTLTWSSIQRTRSSARPSGSSPTCSRTMAPSNDTKRAGSSAATANDLEFISTRPSWQLLKRHPSASSSHLLPFRL